jgi:hypothetical protein
MNVVDQLSAKLPISFRVNAKLFFVDIAVTQR